MNQRRIVSLTLGVYSGLAAIGLGWCVFRQRPMVVAHPHPWLELEPWESHLGSLAAGVVVALTTVWMSRWLVSRFRWTQELHVAFRETLGPLTPGTILVLALCSGIGEEIFFRVALQPSVGWVAASVIFGLVHVAPDRRFVAWTLWAVVMGFVLGAIFEATGSVLGAVVAHIWINHENLHHIVSHDPRGPSESSSPRLVDRTERR